MCVWEHLKAMAKQKTKKSFSISRKSAIQKECLNYYPTLTFYSESEISHKHQST